MLIILIVVIVPWACTYVKTHQTVHFKYVQIIVCQLYFKKIEGKTKDHFKRMRSGVLFVSHRKNIRLQ